MDENNDNFLRDNYDQLCRFCLKRTRTKQDYFNHMLQNITVNEEFWEVFGIKITNKDGLPAVICANCNEKLPTYLKFHKTCLNSYRVLKEWQNNGLIAVKDEYLSLDEQKEVAEPPSISPKSDSDCNEDDEPNDRCSDFQNAEQPPTSVLDEKRAGRKSRQCNVCGKIVQRLKDHLLTHTLEKSYSCEHCYKSFKAKGNLATHLKIHLDIRNFKCHICPKDFVSSTSLKKHLLVHSQTRNYVCEICKKAFNQAFTLKMHLERIHIQNATFQCSFTLCGRKFYTAYRLRQHQKTHAERISCTVCHKKLKNQKYLDIHSRTHSNICPYSCKICKKSFATGSALANHQKTHNSSKKVKGRPEKEEGFLQMKQEK